MLPHNNIALLSLLSLATALVMGCATAQPAAPPTPGGEETPIYGGILINHPGDADPPSFDLQKENVYNANRSVSPAYNNLITLAPPELEKLVPDLAEKWEYSPDGKTLTFTLRKGVKFHNGNDFTSADVKFNLDRMRGVITEGPGALVSPRKDLVGAIERIDTPDPHTAVVRLKYPQASLVPYLATVFTPMYNKEWIEAGHDPQKEVNGTGAFKFKEYIRGTSVELVKNDNYWNKGLPYLDGVKTYIIPDRSTVLASLRTGQVMFMLLTQSQYETLQPQVEGGDLRGKLSLVKVPTDGGGAGNWLNTTKKPFDDLRVRQALNLAVDRKEVAKIQGGPDAVVRGWMATGTFYALPPEELAKLPGYGPDKAAERAEARRLLAEAGFPNGLALKGITRNGQNFIDTAIVYTDQFKKVGITVEIQLMDSSVFYERLDARDFDISLSGGGSGTGEDPDSVFGQFHKCGSPRNYGAFCDPKVEDLFSRQSQAIDPKERQKLSWELEKLVINLAPSLSSGYSTPAKWAVNTQVHGVLDRRESQCCRLDQAWLAK